jgi:4,5-DOPA dioxygenase extradiol
MLRKDFLELMAALPVSALAMRQKLENNPDPESGNSGANMPLLFLGHGSPMNAIEENEFVAGFREIAKSIPRPKAILCISAHWETPGTRLTAMKHPKTIHDFGGFPDALFKVQYPAPGSPELARQTIQLLPGHKPEEDHSWGLDHGAWSVLKHLYPNADIPVVQMSLDYHKNPTDHYKMAGELQKLRKSGVLIVGSGNLVHNLGMVAWNRLNEQYAYDWALEAMDKMRRAILDDDHQKLIDYARQGSEFQLSIPSPEHFLPLLYILGLKEKEEDINIFNDQPLGGSLSMTSLKLG